MNRSWPSMSHGIPGARPLRSGDLDSFWPQGKHDEIVSRAKYLVNDDLEEPPHIREARKIITERGDNWCQASDEEIFRILDQLPRPLFHPTFHKRQPQPPPESDYHTLMTRIHKSELEFYGFDSASRAGQFLSMLQNARTDPDSASFYQRLKQAGITIDKIIHFTSKTTYDKNVNVQRISLPLKIEDRRMLFVLDLARFLAQMQGSSRSAELPETTYKIPAADDEYIEQGIMKVDGRTLVFDTTLNNSVLQSIQEGGFRPGVIAKEFTFWHDGADEDVKALEKADGTTYDTTHWLTEYYDVWSRHPGSGFVACNPTIYIRKGSSLVHALKRSASNLVRRAGFKPG